MLSGALPYQIQQLLGATPISSTDRWIDGNLLAEIKHHLRLLTRGQERPRWNTTLARVFIKRSHFIRWATAKDLGSLEFWGGRPTRRGSPTASERLESTGYETPDLTLLVKAVEKFWLRHDALRPPKKETIVSWLVGEGASARIARSIDTIIRSPQARRGGNKRIKRAS
jgi:hypothetical protein